MLLGALALASGTGLATQVAAPSDRLLLARVWQGVDQAAREAGTACGTVVETRASPLFSRPRVFHGTFCASGTTAFRLDYAEPEDLRIIYNDGVLNVTTESGRRTDVLEIGPQVRRTQQYFSGPHALANLERDFRIEAAEDPASYVLTFAPVSGRFASRIRQVRVTVGHDTYRLRRLEIRGKNGVDSVFDVRIDRMNVPLDPATFKVYRPSVTRNPGGHDGH